jgi:hypothetical protein
MDELVTILESMLDIFEGSPNSEPTSNTMEMPIENDEAIGVEIVGLQETCQRLYLGVHSTCKACGYNTID